ncbi:MAG: hypothetical protein R3F60_33000 [bacterium]
MAPFGIPFKLQSLGLALEPWVWGPRFATGYTVIAVILAVVAGRRRLDRRGMAAVWLALITVAGLRGPMGPAYLLAGPLMAMLLVAAELRTVRGWAVWSVVAITLSLNSPALPESMVASLVSCLALQGALAWLICRRWPALDAGSTPHALGEGAG